VPDVRRAAAKLLLFVVVVMAWRAMPLGLLKLIAGLGRVVIRASMSHTLTKGPCHKHVRVGRELLHPSMWS